MGRKARPCWRGGLPPLDELKPGAKVLWPEVGPPAREAVSGNFTAIAAQARSLLAR